MAAARRGAIARRSSGDPELARGRGALALIVAGIALSAGCGAAPPAAPSLRHAGRVDAVVIRALEAEQGADLDADELRAVREEAVQRIAEAVDDLSADAVEGLRLDIAVVEVSPRGAGARARCLITVSTVGPPERTRAILQGAAAVNAHERPRIAAASGAVRAALRRLPHALSAL